MKATHSNGPWEMTEILDHEGGPPVYRVQAKSTLFLTVAPCADGYVPGENEANARLIASAPALLEEVERLYEDILAQVDDMVCDAGDHDGGSADSCEHCRAVADRDRIKALIIKATGGPP